MFSVACGDFIQTIEKREGRGIACPKEIAWRNGCIDDQQLDAFVAVLGQKSSYGQYLNRIAQAAYLDPW
jgi:dTDP-glucose pyrophosphorylase